MKKRVIRTISMLVMALIALYAAIFFFERRAKKGTPYYVYSPTMLSPQEGHALLHRDTHEQLILHSLSPGKRWHQKAVDADQSLIGIEGAALLTTDQADYALTQHSLIMIPRGISYHIENNGTQSFLFYHVIAPPLIYKEQIGTEYDEDDTIIAETAEQHI